MILILKRDIKCPAPPGRSIIFFHRQKMPVSEAVFVECDKKAGIS